jgi:hypothetical protein
MHPFFYPPQEVRLVDNNAPADERVWIIKAEDGDSQLKIGTMNDSGSVTDIQVWMSIDRRGTRLTSVTIDLSVCDLMFDIDPQGKPRLLIEPRL